MIFLLKKMWKYQKKMQIFKHKNNRTKGNEEKNMQIILQIYDCVLKCKFGYINIT